MAPVETEYYDLLGVTPNMIDRDLRKVYEELVGKISKAYQVLSDPNLRELYDKYGAEAVDQEGNIDMEGIAGSSTTIVGGDQQNNHIGEIAASTPVDTQSELASELMRLHLRPQAQTPGDVRSATMMVPTPGMPMTMGANMGGPHIGNAMSLGMICHPSPNGMSMNQTNQQMAQIHREHQHRQAMHRLQSHGPALGNILSQGAGGSNSSAPNAFPQNAAVGAPQSVPGGGPPGISAPPTPGVGPGGMTAPSSQGTLNNGDTPATAPSHPAPVQSQMPSSSDQSIIPTDFLQSFASQRDTSFIGNSLFGHGDPSLGMDFERDFDEWFNPDTGL